MCVRAGSAEGTRVGVAAQAKCAGSSGRSDNLLDEIADRYAEREAGLKARG
jgi:hypothetical protein